MNTQYCQCRAAKKANLPNRRNDWNMCSLQWWRSFSNT